MKQIHLKKRSEELNAVLVKQADHTKLVSESIDDYLKILKLRKKTEKELEELSNKQEPLEEGIENLKLTINTFKKEA